MGLSGTAICDGRGNAGTGARACVIYYNDERGDLARAERAEKLPECTNIVAEHKAIQLAMEMAKELGITHLEIRNDSQTPVNQCLGIYQCEAEHLKPLVAYSWELAASFEEVELRWVPRAQTTEADKLCRDVDRPTPTVESPFRQMKNRGRNHRRQKGKMA